MTTKKPVENIRGFHVDSTKAVGDKKSYRLVILRNGLRAMLVHDPESDIHDEDSDTMKSCSIETGSESESSGDESDDQDSSDDGEGSHEGLKKSACALAVGVGSFSDPEYCQGLAHYLEHMLFMGSTKYPGENEYDSFITKHGGSANAYTECEYTLYHFDIMPMHLEKGLDIFSQFFISPLMNPDSSDRELNSIESEFNLCKNNDSSRIQELRCFDASSNHPYRTFTWGNMCSLRDEPSALQVDVRKELLQFHSHYYSASAMQLVIQSGASLDDLEALATAYFSEIPDNNPFIAPVHSRFTPDVLYSTVDNRRCSCISFSQAGPPLKICKTPLIYCIKPVKDMHRVILAWNLPPQQKYYRSQPSHYVGHLIGHEGKGSLLSLLRKKQWAIGLSAGIGEEGRSCGTYGAIFEIAISLTEKGVSAWNEVLQDVFRYLGLLRKCGVQDWIHDELKAISEAQFQFQEEEEPGEFVANLAARMLPYAGFREEHFLCGPFLMDEWRPDLITQILDVLTPNGARIEVLSSIFGSVHSLDNTHGVDIGNIEREENNNDGLHVWPFNDILRTKPQIEPRFGLEYWVNEIPASMIIEWEAILFMEGAEQDNMEDGDAILALPLKNFLIPTDFSLKLSTTPHELEFKELINGPMMGLRMPLHPPPSPQIVLDKKGIKVWHLQDTKFRQPRAEIYLKLVCPDVTSMTELPRYLCMIDLSVLCINEELTEFAYMASMAEVHYRLKAALYGFELHVWGFNHRILDLLKYVLGGILNVCGDKYPTARIFSTQKEALMRTYANSELQPNKQATAARLALLFDKHISDDEKSIELKNIYLEDLQSFVRSHLFASTLEYEISVHGNFTKEEAIGVGHEIMKIDGNRAGSVLRTDRRARRMPINSHLIYGTCTKDTTQTNSALEAYWQAGEDSVELRVKLDVLECLMEEPLFDTLRTQQQLGYSVSCGVRNTGGVLGFCIRIISASHSPSQLLIRVEKFLHDFIGTIKKMPHDVYSEYLISLARNKLQPDNALSEEAEHHWAQIITRKHQFLASYDEVHKMQHVTKDIIIDLCNEWFSSTHKSRRLTIMIAGNGLDASQEILSISTGETTIVANIIEERSRADYYPILVGDS